MQEFLLLFKGILRFDLWEWMGLFLGRDPHVGEAAVAKRTRSVLRKGARVGVAAIP